MSIYKSYTGNQLEELFSEFLINSWSFSKVSEFSRNEKAFEMKYLYGYNFRSSASTIAGQAYHEALKGYFDAKKQGIELDYTSLEAIAFEEIDEVKANKWKIQKTTPTVEECKLKALKDTNNLLSNFYDELSVYDIKRVIDVEVYCDEFLTINGVDIPLPCHAKIDLVVETNEGKIAIIDHKSKSVFSSEDELSLSIGKQAVTYINCYESKTGLIIDEVWFIENKISQNRDKSPQLNAFKLTVDKDIRKLYESLLYEPLRRMIQAVNDPDYVYMINDSDNFVDKAELYDFWAKTMIAEVEDFNVAGDKKELIKKRLKKIRDVSISTINPKIIKEFKKNASEFIQYDLSNKNMTSKEKIEHCLRSFSIITNVAFEFDGYSCNTCLLEINPGVKVSSIYGHKMDIANALNVSSVRISKDLIVHEGRSYISIEFEKKREKDLIFDPAELNGQRIPLGKDNFNNTIVWDLNNHSTPHALVCGATGSGKSVSIISTIEYAILSGVEKIVIFDPKHEFKAYSDKAFVYNDIEDIEKEMKNLVEEMNHLVKQSRVQKTLIIFDEFADAVASSRKGSDLFTYGTAISGKKVVQVKTGELKSLEENLRILLQKGRSVGFRIMAATQRASVKVITGDAKVNFPVQICFRVPKEIDSKVVLDEGGAESLCGLGDGLIKSPEYKDVVRFQAFYKN